VAIVASGGAGTRPFVGRQAERAILRLLVRQAAEAQPAMAVITGPSGVGKTALLRWLTAEGTAHGAYVLRASASGTTQPFATVRRLLAPLPDVARAIPGSEVAVVAAEALTARARRRLLMILLDDVHDLDAESKAVLDELLSALDDAGTHHGLRLVVALTAREPLEPGGLAERLLHLDTATSLTLGGLDDHEVFELLTAWGQRPDPVSVRHLVEDTGGLPLLVESEVASTPSFPRRTPRVVTITDAVGPRFDLVSPETRGLLQDAALLGEPWGLDDLALVSARPRETVARSVEEADRNGLVRRERDGHRFTHPLVRSELIARLSEADQSSIHRTIARRLRTTDDGDEQLVRVVDHLLRGQPGDPIDEVAELAQRAGQVAMGWGAWHQASRFLSAAAEACAQLGRDDAELAWRYLDAGRAAYLDLDQERTEQLLTRSVASASRAGDDRIRLTAAMFLARQRGGGRVEIGRRVDLTELVEALDMAGEVELPLLVEARAALAEALLISGETDRALELIGAARGSAARQPDDPGIAASLARVEFAEGIHRLARLEMDRAVECLQRGLAHSVTGGDQLTEVYTRSRLALCRLMEGSVARARQELAEVEELAVARRFWGEVGLAAALRAFAEALAGGDPDPVTTIERAHSNWRRTGFTYIAVLLAPAVHALAARRSAAVLPSMREADLPVTTAISALAAVEANDPTAARVHLNGAGWRGGFRGPVTQNNGAVAVALVEVGDLLDDHDLVGSARSALTAMYERGVMVVIGWPALVPRLLAVVARRAGQLREARRFLDHALALADREQLTVERARVLLERARIDAAAGARPADVTADLVEANRIFDRHSMHGWIARCDQVAQALGVTLEGVDGAPRERTIFTDDVVGSTAANARLGDALYLEQLRIHDRIVRARLREHRGLEIKHTGDGLNAAFDDPHDAVRCALAALDDFGRWQSDEPELALRIRCGLAHGPVIPSGGDFFGLVQSQAARLCNLAGAGELLTTKQVIAGLDAPDVQIESLGSNPLRGMPFAVEVFRVRAP
jgi:class 3 adenylate cyclase